MLTINTERLLADLDALAQIGATADGGVTRLAFSPADVAGRDWFRQQVLAAGLEFRQDGAGNLSAVLPAAIPNAPTLMTGSHLDTVKNGGRYDGALGTLAALEALRTLKETELPIPVHLEAISFTDEEGAILGLFGSQAVAGMLTAESLANPRGGRAELEAGMQRLGITEESALAARRDPAEILGFVELHIEQGTRVEEAGADIGVVTGIVGIRSAWLDFYGEAAHAGTMPLAKRRDALWGAAEFVQQAKALVMEKFTPGVMNCGMIEARPGAFNIVPAHVRLALEFRHGTEEELDAMQAALFGLARQIALADQLRVEIEPAHGVRAAPAAAEVVAAIEQAAEKLGLNAVRLMSLAGHDTQAMSTLTPSAMIFVPCQDGISHSPYEHTDPEHIVNGTNAILHTLLALMPETA